MENTTIEMEMQIAMAKVVFGYVQEHVSLSAVIAGGAPRDWFMNKTASDIDIFIQVEDVNRAPVISGMDIELAAFGHTYGYKSKTNTYNNKRPVNKVIKLGDTGEVYNALRQGYDTVVGLTATSQDPKEAELILGDSRRSSSYGARNVGENFNVYNAYINAFPSLKFQLILTDMDVMERVETFTADLSRFYMRDGEPVAMDSAYEAMNSRTITFNGDTTEFYINKMRTKFPDYKIVRPTALTGGTVYGSVYK